MEGLDAILYEYINSLPEEKREEEIEFLFNYLTTEELDDFLRKIKRKLYNKRHNISKTKVEHFNDNIIILIYYIM